MGATLSSPSRKGEAPGSNGGAGGSGLYTIRPATDAELEQVAPSWGTLMRLPTARDEDAGRPMVALGDTEVSCGWLWNALRSAVAAKLEDPGTEVVVAEHPDAPGLALGWVAFDVERRHVCALYVVPEARGAWVGRTLLRHALDAIGDGAGVLVLTPAGRRLLQHVRGREAVAA